jgi:hypothetical protein
MEMKLLFLLLFKTTYKMCMFNKEAKVHDTKLFVGRTQDEQWQLTVYANSVDEQNAKSSNAMVLPFPVPNGTSTWRKRATQGVI